MKVTLLDHQADDLSVVNAARVSFAERSEWTNAEAMVEGSREAERGVLGDRDRGLIGFLMRNRHGTPFEHGYFRFHVEAPIFVLREWHRHRVGHSYNEMSGRYVEMEKRFYSPETARIQTGKPGAYRYERNGHLTPYLYDCMNDAYESAWAAYTDMIEAGIAKEQARAVLPLGIYTQMYWSCNPRSLMHFLGLRTAEEAQQEIRELAQQAEKHFTEIMPVTAGAFIANGRVAP